MAVERILVDDRDQWLALRLPQINASETPTVLGLGAYGSRAELYAEKKGLRPPRTDSGLLRRGRWLEASVFEALAEERPHWDVVRAKIYLLDRERRMGATPDGFATRPDIDGRGIVQGKVISRSIFRRRWLGNEADDIATGDAEAPIYYRLQTLTEMMLAEATWGVLAVLVAGEFDATLRLFEVERDVGQEQIILDEVARFFRNHLDAGIMPAFDPQQDADLIRALYPKDDGTVIDLTSNNEMPELVDQWTEFQAAHKRLEAALKGVKAEIQAMMADHTWGKLLDGRALRWKREPRKGYVVEPSAPRVLRLLKQMPQLQQTDEDDDE
jgi:predicted phage-related endonuclease